MDLDDAIVAAKNLMGEDAAVWEDGEVKRIGLPERLYTSVQLSNWRKYRHKGNVRWGSGTTWEAALEDATKSNWKKYTNSEYVRSVTGASYEPAPKTTRSLRRTKDRATAIPGIVHPAAVPKKTREVKLISWNIRRHPDAWQILLDSGADIALLQEASPPPEHLAHRVGIDLAHWKTAGAKSRPWRKAIAKLSDRVDVEWFEPKTIEDAGLHELAVSRLGTLAAATITPATGEPFVVASMYASWETSHASANGQWKYADASAHRVISDLAVLIGRERGHRILAAGDLNIYYGYGEKRSHDYWKARFDTVFDRMHALGLSFAGPQVPGGRCADPWPIELPSSSKNVPTYYHSKQRPETATHQLDFVFASEGLDTHLQVAALNDPEQWGPSDHCRIEITIGAPG